jgi:hypothetical protein
MTVIRAWNEHADNLGAQVVGVRLNTIAGNLMVVAERVQQGAMEKRDFATVWRVQKEFTKVLQELGIVDRAIHRVEVTHRFDEQQQAELEAMVDLRDKKRRRAEEVKMAEVVMVSDADDVPVMPHTLEDFDEA